MSVNLRIAIDGDDVVVRMNRRHLEELSSTGKSAIVANSKGFMSLPEPDDMGLSLSLTLVRKGGSAFALMTNPEAIAKAATKAATKAARNAPTAPAPAVNAQDAAWQREQAAKQAAQGNGAAKPNGAARA